MWSLDSSNTVNPKYMGRFNVRVCTLHCTTVKQSVIGISRQKLGCATRLRKVLASVTKSTCTRFLKFSQVFPKTLLFISVKKSFKKPLSESDRCTSVITNPSWIYNFKFLLCTTYLTLSLRLGVSFFCGADSGKTDYWVGEYIARSITRDSGARG